MRVHCEAAGVREYDGKCSRADDQGPAAGGTPTRRRRRIGVTAREEGVHGAASSRCCRFARVARAYPYPREGRGRTSPLSRRGSCCGVGVPVGPRNGRGPRARLGGVVMYDSRAPRPRAFGPTGSDAVHEASANLVEFFRILCEWDERSSSVRSDESEAGSAIAGERPCAAPSVPARRREGARLTRRHARTSKAEVYFEQVPDRRDNEEYPPATHAPCLEGGRGE